MRNFIIRSLSGARRRDACLPSPAAFAAGDGEAYAAFTYFMEPPLKTDFT